MKPVHRKTAPIEQQQRLSQSILWTLQRNFFEAQGIEAWSCGTVPHNLTCSPFIADSYARVVFGWMRDCKTAMSEGNGTSSREFDPDQPIYIIELGAGSGRFGYLFLKRLLSICESSVLKGIRIKYVMTDFAESNLQYWRAHPWFQSYFDQGVLDFARFDADKDVTLESAILE